MVLYVDREGRPTIQWRDRATANDRRAQGGIILERNAWYHLVLRSDGGQWKMTVNGEPVTIFGENIGRWFSDFTNADLLYRAGALDANPLPGAPDLFLDDIRLWSSALSDEEVTNLYDETNRGIPTTPSGSAPVVTSPAPTPSVPIVEVPISDIGGGATVAPAPGSSEWRASLLQQLARILELVREIQAELTRLRAAGVQ
jgi:hypothetical protein